MNSTVMRVLSRQPTDLVLRRPSFGCTPVHTTRWPRLRGVAICSIPSQRPQRLRPLCDDGLRLDAQAAFTPDSMMRTAGALAAWSSPAPTMRRCQLRAKPCPAGAGAAIPVKRTNAVMLTAIAPMTAKIDCQVGEGIAIWAIPYVAL